MVVEGIQNDISLRYFPIPAAAQELAPSEVSSLRTIEAIEAESREEENETSSTLEDDGELEQALVSVVTEAEIRRMENEAQLYTFLEPVQISQSAPYAARIPNRVVVLGSLVIDVLA
ncbi:MAG TPA: hypothetical protein PLP17_16705 [Oligoflexia bacterium]|nr:hypothetical protein [Oligoflexia bacterium]